jgi:hypothetical protein
MSRKLVAILPLIEYLQGEHLKLKKIDYIFIIVLQGIVHIFLTPRAKFTYAFLNFVKKPTLFTICQFRQIFTESAKNLF